MESFLEAWGLICDYCKKHITEVAYNSWISRIKPVALDFSKGVATLEVPNEFHRQTLNRCYYDLLTEAFGQVFGSGIEIDLRTPDELNEGKETAAPEGKSDDYEIDIYRICDYRLYLDIHIRGYCRQIYCLVPRFQGVVYGIFNIENITVGQDIS